MSQESFNVETIRKYYQDITDLKNKYDEKQRKYKNAHNKLLNTSTAASSVGVVSGVSTIGTAFTVVGSGGSRQNFDPVLSQRNRMKNEIVVHFHSILKILCQKPYDPVWIRQ